MKSLGIDRPTLDDPLYSQKNPHQVFLLLFSLAAIGPLFLTGHSPSAIMRNALEGGAYTAWISVILLGSSLALAGEFWRGHTWTALAVERAGLVLVALGAFMYAIYVYFDPGAVDAAYIIAVTSAYATSCLWRVVQITMRLRWIRKVVREMNERHAGG